MKKLRVWDLPLRLFHWSLAILVALALFTGEFDVSIYWHARIGYAILALLIFRLVWGVVGSRYARFASFIARPAEVIAHVRGLKSLDVRRQVGHNPVGALAVLALLAVLLLQVGSGLFASDDASFYGPLEPLVSNDWSETLTWLHTEISTKLVFLLVGLHVLAIFWYRFAKRKDLIKPMLTGDAETDIDAPPARDDFRVRLFALVLFAGACGVVYWLTTVAAV